MIQYDTNGVTLFYIDSKGTKVSASPLDGDAYYNMEVVKTAQDAARDRNTNVVANYRNELSSAQSNVDAGRPPALVPMAPSEQVVSDTGQTSYRPFVPPLPVLVPLNVAPGAGSITSAAPPDKLTMIYNMVKVMYTKMFPGL